MVEGLVNTMELALDVPEEHLGIRQDGGPPVMEFFGVNVCAADDELGMLG